MNLKVGRWYRTSDGDRAIRITSFREGRFYHDKTGWSWSSTGRFTTAGSSYLDLVEELRDVERMPTPEELEVEAEETLLLILRH